VVTLSAPEGATEEYEARWRGLVYTLKFLLFPTEAMVIIFILCCFNKELELVMVHLNISRRGVYSMSVTDEISVHSIK
jgi:hypothetical protein